jgi:hypothetical protein
MVGWLTSDELEGSGRYLTHLLPMHLLAVRINNLLVGVPSTGATPNAQVPNVAPRKLVSLHSPVKRRIRHPPYVNCMDVFFWYSKESTLATPSVIASSGLRSWAKPALAIYKDLQAHQSTWRHPTVTFQFQTQRNWNLMQMGHAKDTYTQKKINSPCRDIKEGEIYQE